MGFVKDIAKVGTFGLAGLALSKSKKPKPSNAPTNSGYFPGASGEAPMSLLGRRSM